MSDDDATRILDLRGLKCPLPALKTKRALCRAAPGERIVIVSDDPLARIDVPNAAREANGDVVSWDLDGPTARFVIARRG